MDSLYTAQDSFFQALSVDLVHEDRRLGSGPDIEIDLVK